MTAIKERSISHYLDGTEGKIGYCHIPGIGGFYIRFNEDSAPDILSECGVADHLNSHLELRDEPQSVRVAAVFNDIAGKQTETLLSELHNELGKDDYETAVISEEGDCVYIFQPKQSDLQLVYCVVNAPEIIHIGHDEMIKALDGVDITDMPLFAQIHTAYLRRIRLKRLDEIVSPDSIYAYDRYKLDDEHGVADLYVSSTGEHAVAVFLEKDEFVLLTYSLFCNILRVRPQVFSRISVQNTYRYAADFIREHMDKVKELTKADTVTVEYDDPNLYHVPEYYVLFHKDAVIVKSRAEVSLIQKEYDMMLSDCKTEYDRLIAAMTKYSV